MPNRKSKSNHKRKALVPMDFQLNEMVFAKQKGYVPWPGIITAFHPNKPRCVRVDFFAWNQQWYVTQTFLILNFNCLMFNICICTGPTLHSIVFSKWKLAGHWSKKA